MWSETLGVPVYSACTYVAVLVTFLLACRRFDLSLLWFVAVLVSPFSLVAVLVCGRFDHRPNSPIVPHSPKRPIIKTASETLSLFFPLNNSKYNLFI